jgi:hypothetical protein
MFSCVIALLNDWFGIEFEEFRIEKLRKIFFILL